MLSFIYLSQGFAIYPHRQAIALGSDTIQVRPKTFALLLLLLEKPREILNKRYLLDTIWDDVTVEEQVLVQSIRELRQIFGSAEIIQTYPRKGYAWAADVEKQAACAIPIAAPAITPSRWRKAYTLPALVAVLTLLVTIVLYAVAARSSAPQTDVVIVLPIKSQVSGNDYQWVSLGAMDQLIHLLISDKSAQVMNSEYVFQIMQFARLPRDYESEQVAKLFDVSGATLIVEAQLSGAVENYRLDYKLRTRRDVKRGIIFDKDIGQAIYKLGQIVVNQTGQKLSNADNNAQATFGNELMARGVEKLDQKEYDAALSLFTSLTQLEPKNIVAREQLVRTLVASKKTDQAQTEILATLELTNKSYPQTTARMYFFMALALIQQGDIEKALINLTLAEQFAASSNEVLIQSAVAGTRAKIYLKRGDFALAQVGYEQALKFDGVIRCSIGLSFDHINLANLFLAQGKREQALAHYSEAKHLIETHQLNDMRPELDAIKL
jgi:DNA-binding winged helix-turn-helix (wHTH) protein/Flp pilus assembly protein TadD